MQNPTKDPPIGLIDLDGTVADYDTSMRRHMEKLAAPEEISTNWSRDQEPVHIEARRALIKKLPGFWFNLPRLTLGFDVIAEMKKLNFDLHVLTKGPGSVPMAFAEKVMWCQEHLPGTPITLSDDKSLVYGRVLVDDWPAFYLPWLKQRPRGLVVAVAQPWNAGPDAQHPNMFRYDGTNREELRNVLRKAAER